MKLKEKGLLKTILQFNGFSNLELDDKIICCEEEVKRNFCPSCGNDCREIDKLFSLSYAYGEYDHGFDQGLEYRGSFKIIGGKNEEAAIKQYLSLVEGRIHSYEDKRITCSFLCLDTPNNREKIKRYSQMISTEAIFLASSL